MSPERAQKLSAIIFKHAALIGAETEPGQLLIRNADLARDLSGADRCSVWLADPVTGTFRTQVAHGTGELRVPFHQGIVGACYDSGQPITVNDTSSDPRFFRAMDAKTSYRTESVLALPLLSSAGRPIGVLQALNKLGGFQEEDVSLLGLAAAYAASALENQENRKAAESARALHRDLEIAREVQSRLFPAGLPPVRGVDAAAYCQPAKSIGGDFYDAIALSDGSLAFTVGDVAGKGIPAAVLMASLQASLRTQLAGSSGSLAQLIAVFNDTVCQSVSPGRYSTLFCGLYHPLSGELTYVNAGHVAPFLFRLGSGVPDRLEAGGPPVGLFRGVSYTIGRANLGEGDLLFCCSDGLSEAVNAADEMWEDRDVVRLINELLDAGVLAAGNSTTLVDSVVRAAKEFMGEAAAADDMTVFVIRREALQAETGCAGELQAVAV